MSDKKIEIEIEKLRLIAEYFEFPFAVFFMPLEGLKKLEGRTRMKNIQKELKKLEKIRAILEERDG
jgi:type VI protein secretion system component VasA